MKRGFVTATAVIKILALYQIVVKRNAQFIKATLTVTSLDINKSVTLARFNHVKHKNDKERSKEFWEIKKRNGTPNIT